METPPKLTIADSNFRVETRNSIRNSALLINQLETETTKRKKNSTFKDCRLLIKSLRPHLKLSLTILELTICKVGIFTGKIQLEPNMK
jgi:hypothetical protein